MSRLPKAALVPLAAVGVLGWLALPLLRVETDPLKLLPPVSPSVAQAEHVRQAVGSVGELDVVVSGPQISSLAAVTWTAGAERGWRGRA